MTADQYSWQQEVEWPSLNNRNQVEQNKGSLRRTVQNSRPSAHNSVTSVKKNVWSFHPAGYTPSIPSGDKEHHYGTTSNRRDHKYINNLPPLSGKPKDMPECRALFTWGEVSLSLDGKRIVILPVLPGRWGSGNPTWNNIRRFLFQSSRIKNGVGNGKSTNGGSHPRG